MHLLRKLFSTTLATIQTVLRTLLTIKKVGYLWLDPYRFLQQFKQLKLQLSNCRSPSCSLKNRRENNRNLAKSHRLSVNSNECELTMSDFYRPSKSKRQTATFNVNRKQHTGVTKTWQNIRKPSRNYWRVRIWDGVVGYCRRRWQRLRHWKIIEIAQETIVFSTDAHYWEPVGLIKIGWIAEFLRSKVVKATKNTLIAAECLNVGRRTILQQRTHAQSSWQWQAERNIMD